MRKLSLSVKIILTCLVPTIGLAQIGISTRTGLINHTEGNVYLGAPKIKTLENLQYEITEGMNLWTEIGYAEIQLGAGALLLVDQETLLTMEDTRPENISLRLERGSVMLEIFQYFKDNNLRVHYRDTLVELTREGLYRLDANQAQLRIYNGKAVIYQSDRKASAKSNKVVNLLSLSISKFKTKNKDEFHNWAAVRSLINQLNLRQLARINRDSNQWLYRPFANMEFQWEKYDVPYPESLRQPRDSNIPSNTPSYHDISRAEIERERQEEMIRRIPVGPIDIPAVPTPPVP